MKYLVDPVYTGRPSTCSTSYVAWKNIKELASADPDAFFYLTVPANYADDEEQIAFWEKQEFTERVKRFPIDAPVIDRMAALCKFPEDLIQLISPINEETWDADAIITTRIPQIANYRMNSSRPVSFGKGTYRAIFALDDMPMLDFRDTVAWGNTGQVCLHTLTQYLQSDGLILSDLWTKQKAIGRARELLAPSKVKELMAQIQEALPVRLEPLQLRKKLPSVEEFNVVFTGRMTGTRNFAEVAELFRKQFSYGMGKTHVNFIVSTQSQAMGGINPGEIDFIKFEYNNREQFHDLLKNRAHVVVNLSTVEDFSLSTYEPMLFGVPVIVPDKPWSGFLGPDYPFRAPSFIAAYALVNDFIQDYAGNYAKFKQWHESYWKTFVQGDRNQSTSEVLRALINAHTSKLQLALAKGVGGSFHDIAARIEADPEVGETVNVLAYLRENDLIQWHKNWKGIPNTKKPNLHLLKLIMNRRGWRDTLQAGVMVRPKGD